MIVSQILILFLPLLLLAEANFGTGPFHRSPPESISNGSPTISSNLPVNQRIPSPPKLPHHDQQTPPSVHVEPVTLVPTEKSVSVEPTTLPPKIGTDSPIEIQTPKPELVQPSNPFHIDNRNQNTSPYHAPKLASSPWSQPKFPSPSVNQPNTLPLVHVEPVTPVTSEKSFTVDLSLPPKNDTDSKIEIQTPVSEVIQKPDPFHAENINQDTRSYHVSKPASSPWSPPKFPTPSLNIHTVSQPNNVESVHVEPVDVVTPEKSVNIQTPAQPNTKPSIQVAPLSPVTTEKTISDPATFLPKIDTDSPIEIITPVLPVYQKPHPFHTENINQDTSSYYISKPASSPWSPPKFPAPSLNIHTVSQPNIVESVHAEPVIVVTPEKLFSVEPATLPPKIDTDSPIEIQTEKPFRELVQPPNPFHTENINQNTSPYHAPRPAVSPWSQPKLPTPSVNIHRPSQPDTVESVNVEPVTIVSPEKSVSIDPASLPPKIDTDSPIEIQTPKPGLVQLPNSFHINNRNWVNGPYHVPKPVRYSPWTLPKLNTVPSVNIHRASQLNTLQLGHVSHASYVYQTPPTVTSVPTDKTLVQAVSVDPSSNRKKFSTDELLEKQTPKTSLSNSLHSAQTNFIPRPAPSPRIPNKPSTNLSEEIQPVNADKINYKKIGPYQRSQRSANPWDQDTLDSSEEDQISQNDNPPPALTTERPGSNLRRFMCPQAYGYFKYTNQCSEYIECKNSIPLAYTCPVDLYFNPQAKWTEYPCDHPSNVQCDKDTIPLPTTASPPTTTLPPKLVTTPRPNNQKHNYRCPQPHGYFKFSDQCGQYIECKNYVALMFLCPAGLHFNPRVEWTAYPCEHPSIVQCDSEPSDEKTPRPTEAPTTTAVPPTPSTRPPPPTTTAVPPTPSTRPPPPTTRSPPPPPTSRQPPRPPTTRRSPPPPTTRSPPPPTTRSPPPPPTTRSPPPPPPTITWRPRPPTTRPPPPTTRSPPPPPTSGQPPRPPSTRRPPPPPTTRSPPPPLPTITWRPRPPTTRPPPPTTRQPPPPPPTTRSPPPPPTTRQPTPPPTTSPLPVITPGPKNPPDYNICLQQFGYFRFSDHCGEYIECKHYVPLILTCPVGLHFNPLADWTEYPCDHPSKVQCNEESVDPKVPSTTQPPSYTTTQSPVITTSQPGSKLLDFKCPEAHGYFEHNDQCSEYIECKNNVPLAYTCPSGLHFNVHVHWTEYPCDHPSKVQCNKESGTKQPTENSNVTSRPVVTPQPTVATPKPTVVTQSPTAVTPYLPRFPTQGTVRPSTERPSFELIDYYCHDPNAYYSVASQCDTYIECQSFKATQRFCPAGLHFDPKVQWPKFPCNYPSRVQCDKEPGTEQPTEHPNVTPRPTRPTFATPRSTVVTPYIPRFPTQGTVYPPTPAPSRPPVVPPRPTIATTVPTVVTQSPTAVTPYSPRFPTQGTVRPSTERPSFELIDYYCREPNGYYAVASQCDTYIECKSFKATQRFCPAGLHFDPKVQWPKFPCNYPSRVQCDKEPGTEQPTKHPNVTPRPTRPTFATPRSTVVTPSLPHFPTQGTVYPPTPAPSRPPVVPPRPTIATPVPTVVTQSPTAVTPYSPRFPTQGTVRPSTERPSFELIDYYCREPNGYYAVASQCDTYIECKSFKATQRFCPAGLHFDPKVQWPKFPCNYPSRVQCDKEPGTEQPTEHPNVTPRPTRPTFATPRSTVVTPSLPHFPTQGTMYPPTPAPSRTPVVPPRPTIATRVPTVVTQSPTAVTPYSPRFPTQGTVRPSTERPSFELIDYYCREPNGYYAVASQCDTYIECKSFKATQRFCPAGLHFDPKVQWPKFPCNYPSRVQCDKEPGTEQPTEHPNVTPRSTRPTFATPRSTVVTPYIPRFPTQGTVYPPTPSPSRPPVVPPRPTIATPAPTIVTQSPTAVTPYIPWFPTQGTVRPSTERPSFELIDYNCREPNGYYAVASQCDTYIECKSNNAIQHFCPAGLHFNPKAQWPYYPCDYPSKVQCKNDSVNDDHLARPTIGTPRPTIATSRRPTGPVVTRLPRQPTLKPSPSKQPFNFSCPESNGFYSVASQCDAFVECKDGIAMEHTCPDGLLFNTNAHWPDYPCGYPSEVTCSSGDVVRQPNPTAECPRREGFFPTDSGDCGEYIVCHAGIATINHCPPGLVFNFDKLNTCDWPINVPACNQTRALEGFVCPLPSVNENALHVHKYRYKRSCTNFIACQKGQPRFLTCDAGLHFNEETESCVDSGLVMDCDA